MNTHTHIHICIQVHVQFHTANVPEQIDAQMYIGTYTTKAYLHFQTVNVPECKCTNVHTYVHTKVEIMSHQIQNGLSATCKQVI